MGGQAFPLYLKDLHIIIHDHYYVSKNEFEQVYPNVKCMAAHKGVIKTALKKIDVSMLTPFMYSCSSMIVC